MFDLVVFGGLLRIAYFSPVTPRRSGIADYSESLLRCLASLAEVELFIEDYAPASDEIRTGFRWRHWREFEAEYQAGRFDAVVYHIGNNGHHVYIYDLALRFPGVIVLHDFNLHYLLAEALIVRGDWDGYLREVEYNAGPDALQHAERVRRGETAPDYERIAMNRRLLEASAGAIVHSDYMGELIRQAGFNLPVARIAHGVSSPTLDGEEMRGRLGLAGHPVAGSFGFLKPYKRTASAIRALSLLPEFPHARLLLVGEEHPHYPLRPLIEELGLGDRVHLTGFVPLEDFYRYISACDVCINLRFPTVGETSGSVLREMAAGKPVIVSDVGSFAELPNGACFKVPITSEEREAQWVAEYLAAVWNSPGLRAAMGERARRWTIEECSWQGAAEKYVHFLAEVFGARRAAVAFTPQTTTPADEAASEATTVQTEMVHFLPSAFSFRPDRFDRSELRDYILSWAAASPGIEEYVQTHIERMVQTIEMTPPATNAESSVLEMGCYMQITPALSRFLGYQQIRGSYYGPAGRTDHKTVYSSDGQPFSCSIDLFNAEKDRFPYADASFDTVLCCELVEHLYFDPMFMMSEINRILKPGGRVVLTTPNITGVRAMNALMRGYHPGLFHAYMVPNADGEVDARHNREYAPRDVKALLEKAGFRLRLLDTGWIEPAAAPYFHPLEKLLEEKGCTSVLRGDIIYAMGVKTGPVVERYPVELYTSF